MKIAAGKHDNLKEHKNSDAMSLGSRYFFWTLIWFVWLATCAKNDPITSA